MNNTRPPEETAMALSPEEYRQRQTISQIKYNANHTTRIAISLNNRTDADILSYLQTASNKQGLIKELLRNHMAKEGYTYEPDSDA